ncbi:uncharacterized protein LOC122428775 [Cervus canadensis]|uniref:uncharacterized protein LOC122428775 n=1 Tax=Cervus canadensis TaxID=1574408 RepID=UPI001C9E8FCB|nr:uncharacterized protein LOC122428775 [Cervus canadensis]
MSMGQRAGLLTACYEMAGSENRKLIGAGFKGFVCRGVCRATTRFLLGSSISSGFRVVLIGITGSTETPGPLRQTPGFVATAPIGAAGAYPAFGCAASRKPRGCSRERAPRPLATAHACSPRSHARRPFAAAAHAAACSGRAESAATLRPPSQLPALGRGLGGCCSAGRVVPLSPPEPGYLRNSALGLWGAKCNPNSILPNPAQINTPKHSHRRRRDPRPPRRIPAACGQARGRDPGGVAARDRPLNGAT